ncbi:hypothetical protein NEH16_10025 [Streptomyces drozdowiczii]|uniref:Uncharacterized protein n=1 Tax=Streptomyces drozdowiczii TaxID=202862 RepID=A0ABY6Q2T3_9ACTN|nr:hypothetical protein NEH16_10025 [Streptomyces drozdowiczii]
MHQGRPRHGDRRRGPCRADRGLHGHRRTSAARPPRPGSRPRLLRAHRAGPRGP